ncbi:MAG: hypothetical protein COT36_02040 [Parcubacteria group bacterium CG08_land_8_20_14_0_20_38_56]|nr:MAG: hypothetical protein COT36_02040 [Parcubacteria group bacterium CG08_land_8_20_14_0_20_38_56]
MSAKETLDKLYRELRANLEEKDRLIKEQKEQLEKLVRFNGEEIARLKEKHKENEEARQAELDSLDESIRGLIKDIEKLTSSPPIHVGKVIKAMEDGTVIILDNHRAIYRIAASNKIKMEELEEGSEVEYTVDMTGKPLAVFNVRKPRREEEIITVKELLDENTALAVLPGDTIKLVNIAEKAKGTLEKGDEVFYDAVINFITGKVPKTGEKVDLSHVVRKTYQDIGGLKYEIRKVREVVELPLRRPEVFEKLGVPAPKGILLSGPPGCGKTLIGQVVANECGVFFIHVSGPEFMSPYPGEPEAKLRGIFEAARRYAPAIIFLDEIEAIAEKREEAEHGHERRLVSQLLSLMDGLTSRERVIVIAATNRPNILDEALRRPGRFDREIIIHIPDRDGRLEILKIHSKNMPLCKDVDLEDLADRTHGFTGADLEALCKEAAMLIFKEFDFEELGSLSLEKIEVSSGHFNSVLEEMKPSIMREVIFQKPTETWDDVGGLDDIKRELKEVVSWGFKFPALLKTAGHEVTKGVLLYGPPGCGKTLIARALANECGVNFIPVKGPQLIVKWVGESEKAVRDLFKRARQSAPCIIFFDEIEALVSLRGMRTGDAGVSDKVTSQLLTELDGIENLKDVFVLAATNRIDLVDPALVRPGRIDKHFRLPPPGKEARRKIFEIHTRKKPLAKDVDLAELVKKTEPISLKVRLFSGEIIDGQAYFSGADIKEICRRAGEKALREFIETHKDPEKEREEFSICMKYFEESVKELTPAVRRQAEERAPEEKESIQTEGEEKKIKELTDEDLNEVV